MLTVLQTSLIFDGAGSFEVASSLWKNDIVYPRVFHSQKKSWEEFQDSSFPTIKAWDLWFQ